MRNELARDSYDHHDGIAPEAGSTGCSLLCEERGKGDSEQEIQDKIDRAVRGQSKLSFGGTLKESWQKTSGVKLYLLGAWLLLGIVVVAIMEGFNLMGLGTGVLIPEKITAQAILLRFSIDMMSAALIMPLLGGFIMMAIKHIDGNKISFKTLFAYTDKTLPLFIANTMMMGIVTLSLVLGILPALSLCAAYACEPTLINEKGMMGIITLALLLGFVPIIYLCVAYACAPALIIDKGMKPWAALETSRKAVSKQWFRVAALVASMVLIFAVSALPMGIGLIWTLPMMIILFSVIYKNIFGISS